MRLTPSLLRRSLLALTAAAALALAGCASNPGSDPASAPSTSSSADAASGTCQYPADGQAAKQADAPDAEPTVTGEVSATIKTSAGDLAVTLDADKTPCTVNSFLSLGKQSYFDGTQCHRLTTQGIFVLQCGDPSGTGAGGPGYSFADELDGSETYEAGTLAMANAGPDTNGSQFFIVYADSQLPPNYTVFGHLDEASTAIVADIGAEGTQDGGPDGAPKTPVALLQVTQN
ncbi:MULTISPECIES: peptidylprolyl isomerase [unclassified Microbacterium]|uniref:peptidylprolyl isomerase n=1 Tax=unclassified Microbacterium TaxID=2609290 RepID=UPI002FCCF701